MNLNEARKIGLLKDVLSSKNLISETRVDNFIARTGLGNKKVNLDQFSSIADLLINNKQKIEYILNLKPDTLSKAIERKITPEENIKTSGGLVESVLKLYEFSYFWQKLKNYSFHAFFIPSFEKDTITETLTNNPILKFTPGDITSNITRYLFGFSSITLPDITIEIEDIQTDLPFPYPVVKGSSSGELTFSRGVTFFDNSFYNIIKDLHLTTYRTIDKKASLIMNRYNISIMVGPSIDIASLARMVKAAGGVSVSASVFNILTTMAAGIFAGIAFPGLVLSQLVLEVGKKAINTILSLLGVQSGVHYGAMVIPIFVLYFPDAVPSSFKFSDLDANSSEVWVHEITFKTTAVLAFNIWDVLIRKEIKNLIKEYITENYPNIELSLPPDNITQVFQSAASAIV